MIRKMISRMVDAVCRWHDNWKSPPPPSKMVPSEVSEESHRLNNAVMVARRHVQRADRSLTAVMGVAEGTIPMEEFIRAMRNENSREDDALDRDEEREDERQHRAH